ncbi:MAG: imidazoleglycerol-phosphate dehydratase HisB [Chloroflexi bacterium]|nr:imidazoleglycerol-phosphate dehydratase HisB [Chloroflexota bacterium]
MSEPTATRRGHVHRVTRETDVEITLMLDGHGRTAITTGVNFLDHMLDSLARHGLFDLDIRAVGDLTIDDHHTVEDVAITLGQALLQSIGDGGGIRRFGHAIVPMDEARAMATVDLGGRGVAVLNIALDGPLVGDMKTQMVAHFFDSLAREAHMALHLELQRGVNDHHRVEVCFKALAKALDVATQIDDRLQGEVPSTKGML